MPNMNSILFYSATTPGVAIPGPDLSCKFLSFSFFFRWLLPLFHTLKNLCTYNKNLEDDEFSSNSMMGILSYTTPSVMTLLGRTWD